MYWARHYLEGDRGGVNITTRVGISSEKLARDALTACLSQDEDDVTAFLPNMPIVLGTLYFFAADAPLYAAKRCSSRRPHCSGI